MFKVFKKRWVKVLLAIIILIIILIGIVGAIKAATKPSHKSSHTEATIKPTKTEPITESGQVMAVHSQNINIPDDTKVKIYDNDGAVVSAGDVIGTATDSHLVHTGTKRLQSLATQIANKNAAGESTVALQKESNTVQNQINHATKRIVAPYDGTLAIDDTDTNNVKVMISSVDKYIDSSVTDFDYDNLAVGNKVKVSANSSDVKTNEKISYISSIAKGSGKVASYQFKTTASPKYRIGQQVTLKIKQNSVIIPDTAVQKEAGNLYIYVVENGHAVKQGIKANKAGATYVVSKDTLSTYTTILKHPGNRDLDGKKV